MPVGMFVPLAFLLHQLFKADTPVPISIHCLVDVETSALCHCAFVKFDQSICLISGHSKKRIMKMCLERSDFGIVCGYVRFMSLRVYISHQ